MRRVTSDRISDLAAIYDDDVELVSVNRAQAGSREAAARRFISARQSPQLRWMQDRGNGEAPAGPLPKTVDPEVRDVLLDEIAEASEVLCELMDCQQVGIRLETLSAPMCPRFHVDQVPCRMLVTLSGTGTEWISNGDVDWHAFDDLSSMDPPVKTSGQIQHLPTGHWSLLKGGAWSDDFGGVVHRSPHKVGDRLLLSLDPIL